MNLVKEYASKELRLPKKRFDVDVEKELPGLKGHRHPLDRRVGDGAKLPQDGCIIGVLCKECGLLQERIQPLP
jgi:hypothetical protein